MPTAALARNVVFVLLDDCGPQEFGDYGEGTLGAVFGTPQFDAIAAQGLRFDAVWANTTCSPTRAQIMMGEHYVSIGGVGVAAPSGTDRDLDPRGKNLFRALEDAGVDTYFVGKWHLAEHPDDVTASARHPRDFGVGKFWGDLNNNTPHTITWEEWEDGIYVRDNSTDYYSQEIADKTVGYIGSATEPFFIFSSFALPHSPLHAPPDDLVSNFMAGANAKCTGSQNQYHCMVEAADTLIGQIRTAIDTSDTTLIIMCDNGPTDSRCVEQGYPSGHGKNSAYRCGFRVPLVIAYDGVAAGTKGNSTDALVQAHDIHSTILELFGVETKVNSKSLAPYLADHTLSSQRSYIEGGRIDQDGTRDQGARNASYSVVVATDTAGNITSTELYATSDALQETDLNDGSLTATEQANLEALLDIINTHGVRPAPPGWFPCDESESSVNAILRGQSACWRPVHSTLDRSAALDTSACDHLDAQAFRDANGDGVKGGGTYFLDRCVTAEVARTSDLFADSDCVSVARLAGALGRWQDAAVGGGSLIPAPVFLTAKAANDGADFSDGFLKVTCR